MAQFNLKEAGELLAKELEKRAYGDAPENLYAPLRYILSLGGKRLRPALTLLGCYLFNDDYKKAVEPAIGVEVFHNFTLMHDDIMDDAPLRRGQMTVHEKWNPNIAILSGDVMFVKAYDYIMKVEDNVLRPAISLFNKCATEVCEGQQFDMDFEERAIVSEEEYIEMIRLKTAVLIGFALRLGALIGGASEEQSKVVEEFGVNVGLGFQLKDDILDVYADQDKFGKQVGGDIISNKKTLMLIKALKQAEGEDEAELLKWLEVKEFDKVKKVKAVTSIYNRLGIKEMATSKSNEYFDKGFTALQKLDVPDDRKQLLKEFGIYLQNRDH
ncbi:polyprenyl synthetase family protein [Flammeovirga kamogawensis]|uniref:Polyprenyl synthetase family protein n=1 Tax=Flammeovirga kamogawensis TaxID=373891 RepID=A0ABX8GZP0_9BACT|nr:polyprenyl synthetase family protein [Flammeovirga kamogawensis]MBB6459534.1 geranylgeranyl diphosphate synthase type II [Flammeovirga kamogawensis]QWG09085.1 polyprenyl synthetase family protein [Flammeovirga kamogawensis]TRX67373.1 polyprenyl synthetase family protein [Flammeovirga kamogawensis]